MLGSPFGGEVVVGRRIVLQQMTVDLVGQRATDSIPKFLSDLSVRASKIGAAQRTQIYTDLALSDLV